MGQTMPLRRRLLQPGPRTRMEMRDAAAAWPPQCDASSARSSQWQHHQQQQRTEPTQSGILLGFWPISP